MNMNSNCVKMENIEYKGGRKRKTARRMKVGRGPMLRPRRDRGEMVVRSEDNTNNMQLVNSVPSNDDFQQIASFATPEMLARDYINALDEIKKTEDANTLLLMLQRKNRMLFLLLISLGLFATYNIIHIPAITDELMKDAIRNSLDVEYTKMGYNFVEKTKMIDEYVKKITQGRFYFGSGEAMTANEILEFLKSKKELTGIIIKLESLYKGFIDVKLEINGTIGSIYNSVSDILKGDVKSVTMILGAGTLGQVFMGIFGNLFTPVFTPILTGVSTYYATRARNIQRENMDTSTLLRIPLRDGSIQYISQNKILETIARSQKLKPLVNGYFDTFLAALFDRKEAWWSGDESSSISSNTIRTSLTNDSINSLETISYNGYGTEWDNMAEMLSKMFGDKIENTMNYMIMSFSSTYLGLLVLGKQEDLFSSENLSLNNTSGGGFGDADDSDTDSSQNIWKKLVRDNEHYSNSDNSPKNKYRRTDYPSFSDLQMSELTFSNPSNSQPNSCDDIDLTNFLNTQQNIHDFNIIINIMNQKAIYNSINKSSLLNNMQKQLILESYHLLEPCLVKDIVKGGRKKLAKKIHKTKKHSKKGKRRMTHKKKRTHRK